MSAHRSDYAEPLDRQAALEQKIAERVDQELKQCLDHAAEGLHWVGPDGTILWANQTELDLLGYTRDEYIGRGRMRMKRLACSRRSVHRRASNRCRDAGCQRTGVDEGAGRANGRR